MSKRNRPLSKKQQRTMQELIKAAETARFAIINITAGKRGEGENNGIRTEGV